MQLEINLKNDIVFKSFFSRKGNEKYLIDFLSSLIKTEINKIKIFEEVHVEKLFKEEKGGSMDLQVEINDEIIVNIEMQKRNNYNIEQRTKYYSSKIISREVGKRNRIFKNKKSYYDKYFRLYII